MLTSEEVPHHTDELDRLQAKLGPRYSLVRELGRGGTALVYLAQDTKLHRRVAIKVLQEHIGSAVGLDRFLREIEIAANLQHPGILPVFDSGGANGFLYYVMPYVEGESLRDRLLRDGPLPPREAVRIAREVADALDYAHKHGVVHRDIKPENILLEERHAVVADFGIACAIGDAADERLTISGHTVGTPTYMSPEQAGGERELDGRSDIYSLSCVLYEMLTGRPPFTGETAQALISGHMLQRPKPVNEVAPHVPAPLAKSVQKGLSKKPGDRFDTPEDLSIALDLQIGASVRRWSRRARWRVAAIAIVVTAGAAATTWLATREPQLDPNSIVVFPITERDATGLLSGAGQSAAIAIEIALEQSHPLKWIDGWARLPEDVRRDPLLMTADLSRSITLDRRAAYYIDGVLTAPGDSIAVLLNLHDGRADTVIERASASGLASSTSVEALAIQAALDLLPSLVDPGRESVLPVLAGREAGAIALCIQGEREYRLAHFANALDLYQRSVGRDSLLALSAMKGALAAFWEREYEAADKLIGIAVSQDSLLPAHYAHLARCIEGYETGDADRAVSECREALTYDPDWAEALTWLGEVYYHLMPSEPRPDSLAAFYFDRAAQADSGFAPSFKHAAEIAIMNNEPDRAVAAIDHMRSMEAFDEENELLLSIMIECVRSGPAAVDWEAALQEGEWPVLNAGTHLAAAGAHPDCGEASFKAILRHPGVSPGIAWGAVLGLQGLLVSEARYNEALALLDSVKAAGVSRVQMLYVIDHLAGAPFEAQASGSAAFGRELFGEYYQRGSSETQWAFGAWHARTRDVGVTDTIAAAVQARAEETGERKDRLLAHALAGHLAYVRKDTLEAIRLFEELQPTAPPGTPILWHFSEPLAVEKLLLAELLLSRGEYQRAHDVATVFDHNQPIIYLPFLAGSLAIRYRAAVEMGDQRLAERYRARLLKLGRQDLLPSD